MNAERMHAVAKRLRADLESSNLVELIRQLDAALTSAAGNPQEASYQDQVSSLRTQVQSALANSDVNEFSPVERQVLEEWGVSDYLGRKLADRLETIFNENQITLVTARDRVKELVEPIEQLAKRLDELVEAFEWFHIGAEGLQAGEFEIDVLVPRSAVRSELRPLGLELAKLERILAPFVELTTGSGQPVEVRSIGSSDFILYLVALPYVADCLSTAIEKTRLEART